MCDLLSCHRVTYYTHRSNNTYEKRTLKVYFQNHQSCYLFFKEFCSAVKIYIGRNEHRYANVEAGVKLGGTCQDVKWTILES